MMCTEVKRCPDRACFSCGMTIPICSLRGRCAPCRRAWDREYWARSGQTKLRRWKRFGLTEDEYNEIWQRQGERCAICGTDNPGRQEWNIDHDHSCCAGKKSCGQCVRGILCLSCNMGLGNFKDDFSLLIKAAEYLTGVRDVVRS